MPHTIDELERSRFSKNENLKPTSEEKNVIFSSYEQEIKLLQDEISYLHHGWTTDLKKYKKLQDEYDMMKLELQQLYSLIERCNIKIIK